MPGAWALQPWFRPSQFSSGWICSDLDLSLVSLRSGRDLAAVGQDGWLTGSPGSGYAMTRRWDSAIRAWAPWAVGLTWRSLREPEGFVYVFFGDCVPRGCLKEVTEGPPLPAGDRRLSAGTARPHVEDILASYRVSMM